MKTTSNLLKIHREVGGGFLATIAGLADSPVIYVPVVTTGFCSEDTESGVPSAAKGAAWIRVRRLKGHACDTNFLALERGEKGWRLSGWGGLRVSAIARDNAPKQESLDKNVQALINSATSAELAEFSPTAAAVKKAMEQVAAEKSAIVAADRAERERKEQTDRAERKAVGNAVAAYGKVNRCTAYNMEPARARAWVESIGGAMNSSTAELVELATLAAEIKAMEAAEAVALAEKVTAAALGVSTDALRSMSEKQRRQAAHKARLAGKF